MGGSKFTMDNSWDNSAASTPKGPGKFRGALVTAAVIALSLVAFGAVWGLWFSNNQARLLDAERERARPDWASAALIVEGLRTEAGTRALFQANPKLGAHFRSEQEFLEVAARWRPSLEPLPRELPRAEDQVFGHRHGFGLGPTILSYRMPKGSWITLQWDGPYDAPARQLTQIECAP